MLNKVTVMGRLCADPELRRTASGIAVCNARIAVERDYADQGGHRRVPLQVFREGPEGRAGRTAPDPQLDRPGRQQARIRGNRRGERLLRGIQAGGPRQGQQAQGGVTANKYTGGGNSLP